MKTIFLVPSCFMALFASVSFASSVSTNVNVGYDVAKICEIRDLPTNIMLSTFAKEIVKYDNSFSVWCNTTDEVGLSLTSSNQDSSQARLLLQNGSDYLNYDVYINLVKYSMGQQYSVRPGYKNKLHIEVAKPLYAGKYFDQLSFVVNY